MDKQKILITGGSGLIGQALSQALVSDGYEVWALTRSPDKSALPQGVKAAAWDGRSAAGWENLASGARAIFNLAGANIGRWPWTKAYKEVIRSSRVNSGQAVVEAVQQSQQPPSLVVQIAGVGYYGNRGDAVLDEQAGQGEDFLAGVSADWENASKPVAQQGVRHVVLRAGVVLSKEGGVLEPFVLQHRLFAGGPLGSGKQWISWIHIDDLVNIFRFLLDREGAVGTFNASAPQPVTNADFGRTLGKVMGRPYWLPAPAFAMRLVLGEMSQVVLEGQRVIPERLLEMGFSFQYPELRTALEDVVKK